MNEKRIKVPEGMLNAAMAAFEWQFHSRDEVLNLLESSLQWLAENPVVPTREQEFALHDTWDGKVKSEVGGEIASQILYSVVEWQRRMFASAYCSSCGCLFSEDDLCDLGLEDGEKNLECTSCRGLT